MFECVQICSVSDTFHAIQHPAQSRSPRAVSGIECRPVQRVQRPGACRALRGLPWYLPRPGSGTACATACAVQSFRVRWGLGPPPAGHTAAAQPRPVSPVTTEKIKKAQKITPPLSPISKIPPQKQKDLYKGSAFCAILALQALKGRNLQWLKIK